MEDLKIKLAVFWMFIGGVMLSNTLLYLLVPGVMGEIQSGQIVGMQAGAELILGMAIAYYWVPLVMAVLALALKGKLIRWVNIGVGGFYAFFILFELTMNVTTVAYPHAVLMDLSVFAVAALIIWTAAKWNPSVRRDMTTSEMRA